MTDTQNLKTIRQFCADNPSFTEGGLRHLVFHSETNGFRDAVYRIGKRVYLHEGKFFQCVEAQNQRERA